MIYYLIWFVISLNFFGFCLMGVDKRRARRHRRRLAERTLLLLAISGGAAGVWAGMYAFRHKTEKLRFVYGLPVVLTVQAYIFWRFFLTSLPF
jgi:uncharacterized membrane protein YsdA (DUF1294 family)